MELPALADAFAADDGLLLATLRLRVGGAAAEDDADAASFFDRLPAVALWRACGTALEQLAPTPAADGAADAAVPNGHAPTEAAAAAAGETASARLELIEASAAMLLGETVGGRARSPSTAAEEARGSSVDGLLSLARAACAVQRRALTAALTTGQWGTALGALRLFSNLLVLLARHLARAAAPSAAADAPPPDRPSRPSLGVTPDMARQASATRTSDAAATPTAAATAAAAAAAAASAAAALGGAWASCCRRLRPTLRPLRARATTAAAAVRRSWRHSASPPRCC